MFWCNVYLRNSRGHDMWADFRLFPNSIGFVTIYLKDTFLICYEIF